LTDKELKNAESKKETFKGEEGQEAQRKFEGLRGKSLHVPAMQKTKAAAPRMPILLVL